VRKRGAQKSTPGWGRIGRLDPSIARRQPAQADGRQPALGRLPSVSPASDHDVCVIGGGVTGAGIARDLSLRGLSVLLLEKGDWGAGTTGASSWMIHGGPRYLEFDWDTTRLSTQDAGYIVSIARNLVYRVVFLIPVLPHDRNNIERMETAMEVYDRFQPLKKAHPHRRLTAEEAQQAEPGLTPDLIGAVTMEEWGVDPHRLVYANVEDAVAHGARAMNHTKVIDLVRDGGKVIGVRYQAADGSTSEARARVVVNATGPWSPQVSGLAGLSVELRPAKGIHIVYPHRISNFSISAESVDGRDLLMVSHAGFTLLGTTDDDFYGDLDSVDVMQDEIEYLLQGFERVFPSIRSYRPVRTTTGVRPTLFKWRRYEDELSRRYEVIDHAKEGVEGFVTIAGGKLSMYRLMAEQTSDAVCRKLGHQAVSTTATTPLPGNESEMEPAADLARRCGIPALAAVKLQSRHGTRAEKVLDGGRAARLVCRCEPMTEAELAYSARSEQVRSLADAFRRVGLAAGPCAGAACVLRAAEVIGAELGWSASQRFDAAREFVRGAWLGRAPVLGHAGWAQEELAQGAMRGLLN
jgi:glycerol-3-phosphate dehydrogenase